MPASHRRSNILSILLVSNSERRKAAISFLGRMVRPFKLKQIGIALMHSSKVPMSLWKGTG